MVFLASLPQTRRMTTAGCERKAAQFEEEELTLGCGPLAFFYLILKGLYLANDYETALVRAQAVARGGMTGRRLIFLFWRRVRTR